MTVEIWTDVEKAQWILTNGSPEPKMDFYSYTNADNKLMIVSRVACPPWLQHDNWEEVPVNFTKIGTTSK